jgi:hypothetical protein
MTTAFRCCYSDWKLIRTRQTVQIIFEIPLEQADAAYQVLGGMPDSARESWFAVAALKPEKENPKPATPSPVLDKSPEKAKRTWEEFHPAQQAGIRSHDVRFAQFLEEEYPTEWRELQNAAECIRSICCVKSRSELGTDPRKRILWNQLDKHFSAWEAKVRMNA